MLSDMMRIGCADNPRQTRNASKVRWGRVKLVILTVAAAILSQAAEPGFIVGMYSVKERPGLGGHFLFQVNGKPLAKIRFPTYYRLDVQPGFYTVTVDDKPPIFCHVISGESCHIRMQTIGKEGRREVELLTSDKAALELQKVMPLEREYILASPLK
jgi:hypothetical protein